MFKKGKKVEVEELMLDKLVSIVKEMKSLKKGKKE